MSCPAVAPRLTPLEEAICRPLGGADRPASLPPARGARAALEAAVLQALQRPPCGVAFSGGRDSSAVLAVATEVARREGLAAPVALTLRWAGVASAEESAWQRMVVDHLGVKEWETIEAGQDLDLLGPVATTLLRRHGLMWPPTIHALVPVLDAVRGGSLMTGEGGDSLFGAHRYEVLLRVIAHGGRPSAAALRRAGVALLPRPARRRVLERRSSLAYPWLTQAAAGEVRAALAGETADEPVSWATYAAWQARETRARSIYRWWMDTLAAERASSYHEPFNDLGVVAALAGDQGWRGFRDRTTAMTALVGDLLPPDVTARATKAEFTDAYFGDHSRSFARTWDGSGLEHAPIRPAGLRDEWSAPRPRRASATLLQRAWLQAHGAE